ncbi:MAG: HPF/RaiA family ribosome-associated protein [Gemmatimonadetes bacterium]|nr:HPF/RaiA family ribosome-associated protein [Gemmatimonadota bacterium]
MQIQVNTDRNVEGTQAFEEEVRTMIARTLDRFSERVTRIEAHVSDSNSGAKGGGADIRCVLEARLAGMNPISVRHQAATPEQAVAGATEKLEKMLQRTHDRLNRTRGRTSVGGAEVD